MLKSGNCRIIPCTCAHSVAYRELSSADNSRFRTQNRAWQRGLACVLLVPRCVGRVHRTRVEVRFDRRFAGNYIALLWSIPSAFVAYTAMVLCTKRNFLACAGCPLLAEYCTISCKFALRAPLSERAYLHIFRI